MKPVPREIIKLKEFTPTLICKGLLSTEEGISLWENHKSYIDIEFPSPKTEDSWILTPKGWAGYLPLETDKVLFFEPKVSLQNLFGMLEYAYRLNSWKFFPDLIQTESLAEFYESLAEILAKKVLERGRKGFYRKYLSQEEVLPYITGRLNTNSLLRKPWAIRPQCEYQEHTPDIEENQILAWTLQRILMSGLCSGRTVSTIRKAYRMLGVFASIRPFSASDCLGRLYNRLNEDYQPLHALCRFFLEHTGPKHKIGGYTFLPFMINMARLYELFVAEWLKKHLPPERGMIRAKENVHFGTTPDPKIEIDLTIYDAATNKPIQVLDTKYKIPVKPSNADCFQIVAYAVVKDCLQAALIYPEQVKYDEYWGEIHVKSLQFPINDNLEEGGKSFLSQLLDLADREVLTEHDEND